MAIASPCISVCVMNEDTGYCEGCFRTLDEVSSWLYFSETEKAHVLAQLAARKNKSTVRF